MNNIFEQVKRSNSLEDYEVFLARYPNSPEHSDEARRRIERIKFQKSHMGEKSPWVRKNLNWKNRQKILNLLAEKSSLGPNF